MQVWLWKWLNQHRSTWWAANGLHLYSGLTVCWLLKEFNDISKHSPIDALMEGASIETANLPIRNTCAHTHTHTDGRAIKVTLRHCKIQRRVITITVKLTKDTQEHHVILGVSLTAIHPHCHPQPVQVSAHAPLLVCSPQIQRKMDCQLRWMTSCVLKKLLNPIRTSAWDKLGRKGQG